MHYQVYCFQSLLLLWMNNYNYLIITSSLDYFFNPEFCLAYLLQLFFIKCSNNFLRSLLRLLIMYVHGTVSFTFLITKKFPVCFNLSVLLFLETLCLEIPLDLLAQFLFPDLANFSASPWPKRISPRIQKCPEKLKTSI